MIITHPQQPLFDSIESETSVYKEYFITDPNFEWEERCSWFHSQMPPYDFLLTIVGVTRPYRISYLIYRYHELADYLIKLKNWEDTC